MTFVSLPALVFTHLNSFICQRTGRSQVVVFIFSFGFKCILRDGGRSISHQEKCPAVDGQFQRRKHRVESGGIIEEQARASAAIEYKIPHVISMLFFLSSTSFVQPLERGEKLQPPITDRGGRNRKSFIESIERERPDSDGRKRCCIHSF